VFVLEKGNEFLAKVRISGGGRCNVTHACFDPRTLAGYYPRGGKSLIGAFHQFQPEDMIAWLAGRGVRLKTEPDGRMFPVTDDSRTIVDCLLQSAREAGVKLRCQSEVSRIERAEGGFDLFLKSGEVLGCDRLLLAPGGCRGGMESLLRSLGHRVEPPVPSLFSFNLAAPWNEGLAGISLRDVELLIPGTSLRQRGPLLFTHAGISGPAVLRLSAWGARHIHGTDYVFPLRIRWLPEWRSDEISAEFVRVRKEHGGRLLMNQPVADLPVRLWEKLLRVGGVLPELRWAAMPGEVQARLLRYLEGSEVGVSGKSLHKEEFVTCGGVSLSEVNFKSMASRICPGLYFAGEVLDIDGITGGFNFQSAWTTGWIAGNAVAAASGDENPVAPDVRDLA
jgi:predicted Rossmann fold flavoprotein